MLERMASLHPELDTGHPELEMGCIGAEVTDAAWALVKEYGLHPEFIERSGRNGRRLTSEVPNHLDQLRERLVREEGP